MAPLVLDVHSGHAFSDERFALPMRYELENVVKSKKRVRFSAKNSSVINPGAEYYTDEDIQIKWWAPDELMSIKKRAKHMSALLRKDSKVHDCFLTMAHRKTTLMLASDFKGLVKLSPSTPDQDLQQWCSHEDGRRGLERFTSRDYCCFRRRDVTNSRLAVLEEQARQAENSFSDVEAVAKSSRAISRRARTFALFFGEADAIEARSNPPPRKRSKTEHMMLEPNPAAA